MRINTEVMNLLYGVQNTQYVNCQYEGSSTEYLPKSNATTPNNSFEEHAGGWSQQPTRMRQFVK